MIKITGTLLLDTHAITSTLANYKKGTPKAMGAKLYDLIWSNKIRSSMPIDLIRTNV